MAHLLGSRFCIDSLRTDVADLQQVIATIASRNGPASSCRSWKYPDKMATDLDMAELLEMHTYTDGDGKEADEENQVAHIVLLELVIDRLILFIQSVGRAAEQALASGRATSAADKASTSIGLVAKKHWTKMSHLCASLQQEQHEAKSGRKEASELRSAVERLQAELSKYEHGAVAVGLASVAHATALPAGSLTAKVRDSQRSLAAGHLLPPKAASDASRAGDATVARDCSHRASQTIETAFVPCLSCGRVQDGLRQAGGTIAAACEAHGLTSHLAKFRRREADALDWLSPNDVARWSAEQSRDVEQLVRLADERAAAAAAALAERAAAEGEHAAAERRAEECQRRAREDAASVEASWQRQRAEAADRLEVERGRAEALAQSRADVERRLQDTQHELSRQVALHQQLGAQKDSLLAELSAVQSEAEESRRHHASELAAADGRAEAVHALLTEQQALRENAGKRNEALQAKQDALLRQLGELDGENEVLRGDVAALEDVKRSLTEQCQSAGEENQRLHVLMKEKEALVERVEREKCALEASIAELHERAAQLERQLVESEERLRLLVDYPDLNGPVNPDFQGSGDIVLDMENQIKANCTRINLLDKQNAGLSNSVSKLKERQTAMITPQQQRQQPQPKGPPLQLWKQVDSTASEAGSVRRTGYTEDDQTTSTHQTTRGKSQMDWNTVAIGHVSTVSASKPPKKSSQPAAHTVSGGAAGSSSVAVYSKLKQAGLLKISHATEDKQSGNRSANEGAYKGTTCPGCNRMYATAAELKLHQSYCTAGIL